MTIKTRQITFLPLFLLAGSIITAASEQATKQNNNRTIFILLDVRLLIGNWYFAVREAPCPKMERMRCFATIYVSYKGLRLKNVLLCYTMISEKAFVWNGDNRFVEKMF